MDKGTISTLLYTIESIKIILKETVLISQHYSSTQSTEGAEFVWVSECQKGEGCEIINQFVFV
jgi:hypothetical protein